MNILHQYQPKKLHYYSLAEEIAHQRTIKIHVLNCLKKPIKQFTTTIQLPDCYYLHRYHELHRLFLVNKNNLKTIAFINSINTNCFQINKKISLKEIINLFWNSPFQIENDYRGLREVMITENKNAIEELTNLKVWLDDERSPPNDAWIHVKNYQDCIQLLKTNRVQEISLDHDLGQNLSGYDVAKFIELQAANNVKPPNKIHCHSQNPVGKQYILNTINHAYAIYYQNIKEP